MTELEAVNTILATIGEAGVSSLATSTNEITDASLALRTLREVATDVQSEGWSWNTEVDVEIAATSTNVYVVPGDTLSVKFSPSTYPHSQYVLRGLRVYDKQRHRFDFATEINSQALVAREVVKALYGSTGSPNWVWTDLPHAAQQYIAVRAARIFSDRYVASSIVFTYTAADEDQARTLLIRSEESNLSNNLLWGNDRGGGQGLGYVPAATTRFRFH